MKRYLAGLVETLLLIMMLFFTLPNWPVASQPLARSISAEQFSEAPDQARREAVALFQQRAFPTGRIPADWHKKALTQLARNRGAQSTGGNSVDFSYKIKTSAPIGPQQLTFTGRDESGRLTSATLSLMVKR